MGIEAWGLSTKGGLPSGGTGLGRVVAAAFLLLPLLSSCVEEPLPQRKISRYDCLREVNLDRLPEALQRCDQVVAAFPADPLPLNERFLLHSLAGKDDLACRDISRAAELARKLPSTSMDPMLAKDLELRRASCGS